jgi:AraC family transcriptional regulator, transcriptional activator of pobA
MVLPDLKFMKRMIKEYYQTQTKAFFSILSVSEYKERVISESHNKWFTILIFSKIAGELVIDDFRLSFSDPQAIFLTPGQFIQFEDDNHLNGYAILFNKEFYCIEYHDSDVSCQGLLFVNNFDLVHFNLNDQQLSIYTNSIKEMITEIDGSASLQEEMLKNLLKNLLIRSNRLFREQMSAGLVDDSSIDFVRKFSDLVEKHFKIYKRVDYYAGLLNIAPASLSKKLNKYGIESPLKIIISRVITEAKRLLIHTDKSIKEIADILGYDDAFYFSRLFTKETGISPTEYKKTHVKL